MVTPKRELLLILVKVRKAQDKVFKVKRCLDLVVRVEKHRDQSMLIKCYCTLQDAVTCGKEHRAADCGRSKKEPVWKGSPSELQTMRGKKRCFNGWTKVTSEATNKSGPSTNKVRLLRRKHGTPPARTRPPSSSSKAKPPTARQGTPPTKTLPYGDKANFNLYVADLFG